MEFIAVDTRGKTYALPINTSAEQTRAIDTMRKAGARSAFIYHGTTRAPVPTGQSLHLDGSRKANRRPASKARSGQKPNSATAARRPRAASHKTHPRTKPRTPAQIAATQRMLAAAAERRGGVAPKSNGARMVRSVVARGKMEAGGFHDKLDRAERREAAALGKAAVKVRRVKPVRNATMLTGNYTVTVLVRVPVDKTQPYGVRSYDLDVFANGELTRYSHEYLSGGLGFEQRDAVKAAVRKAVKAAHEAAPKANTKPRRTLVASRRRGLALARGEHGHTPTSTTASRLASKKMQPPGAAARKAKKKREAHAEMMRRRASLTPDERNALLAAANRDPSGWKTSLGRAGRAGNLTGELASAFAKLGSGGIFTYPTPR